MRRSIEVFSNYKSAALGLAEQHGLPCVSIQDPEGWYINRGISVLLDHFNLDEEDFRGSRSRGVTDIRHAFMYVCGRDFEIGQSVIAHEFLTHHTNVGFAIRKIQDLLDIGDLDMVELVELISNLLNA